MTSLGHGHISRSVFNSNSNFADSTVMVRVLRSELGLGL